MARRLFLVPALAVSMALTVLPAAPAFAANAPGAPTGVTAAAYATSLKAVFSWTPPASTGGATITQYEARCVGDVTRTVTSRTTSATVTGLTNNVAYDCDVRAYNSVGAGAWSSSVAVTPVPILGAPKISSVTLGDESIAVNFTASTLAGQPSIDGYVAECQSSDVADTSLHTVDGSPAPVNGVRTLTIASDGLVNGVQYACTVHSTTNDATAAAAAGPNSAVVYATPRTNPATPTSVVSAVGNTQLSVTVTPAAATGGLTISSYQVSCTTGATTVTASATANPVLVKGLVNGTLYACKGRVTNAAGLQSPAPGTTATGTLTPAAVAATPTIGTAVPANGSLSVSFTAGASVGGPATTGYYVRCGNPAASNGTPVYGTKSPVVVTGLTNGTAYSCDVRSQNAAGTYSSYSSTTTGTPRTTPAAPTIGAATTPTGAGGATINVGYTATPGGSNGGSAITHYRARCTVGTTVVANEVAAGTNPVPVTGLVNGTAYSCTVAAKNAAGYSPESAAVSATPRTAPGVPTSVVATPTNTSGQLAVTWTAPTSTGGYAIGDYILESTTDGVTFTTIADGTSTSRSYTVTGLTNGTPYQFRVSAVNAASPTVTGSTSALSVAATPRRAPNAPTVGTPTPGNASISVPFTALVGANQTGGSAITAYTATCGGKAVSGITSPITVTGLMNGTTYTCTLAATNAAGTTTSTAAATTPYTKPTAPKLNAVTSGNQALTLSFTPLANTAAANGGNQVGAYKGTCTSAGGSTTATVLVADITAQPSAVTVTGLTNGTAYSCVVQAANGALAGGDFSAASTGITGTPRTVPNSPTDVSVDTASEAVRNRTAKVTFTVVPNVAGSNGGAPVLDYTARCSSAGQATQSATGLTTPLTVTGLTNGHEYSCTVVARNLVGSSAASTAALTTPRTVPGTPTGLAGTSGSDEAVALTWTAPDNGGNAITGYDLQSSSNNGISWSASTTVTPADAACAGDSSCGYDVTALTNGTTYKFRVRATNDAGDGVWSSASAAYTPYTTPDAVNDLAGEATEASGQVSLSWTAPAANGSTITDYDLKYSTVAGFNPAVSGTFLEQGTSTATTATVNGLTNGTEYYFAVRSTNAAGDASWSTLSTGVTPYTTPAAPTVTGAAATEVSGEVDLTWTAGAANGDPVSDYAVVYSSDNWSTSSDETLTGSTATSYTVTGLTDGVAYKFKVRAVNTAGSGALSASSSAVTPYTTPDAPGSITLTPGAGRVTATFTAPPANGNTIDEYRLTCTNSNSGDVDTASSATTTVELSGLVNGDEYSCTVASHNDAGYSSESPSATATPRTVPSAPQNLAVEYGNQQMTVSFEAPANENGAAVTSYTARCSAAGSTRTAIGMPTPDGAGVYTLTVTGLVNGTEYDCTATATNLAGASSAPAPVAKTPHTAPGAPTSVSFTEGDQELTVSFAAPGATGGSPITDYVVTCGAQTIVVDPSGTLEATFSASTTGALTNGDQYGCSVTASNSEYDDPATDDSDLQTLTDVEDRLVSDPSTTVTGTPRTDPLAPAITAISEGDEELTITFDEVTGSDIGGASGGIVGYTAACGEIDGSGNVDHGTPATASVTDPAHFGDPITVTGLSNTTNYGYGCWMTATAEDSDGTQLTSTDSADQDNGGSGWWPYGVPGAPANASLVSRGDGFLAVTFDEVTGNDANGWDVDAYRVTCTNQQDSNDEVVATFAVATDIADLGTTGLVVSGLTNGETYDCTVEAHNPRGYSAASATVTGLVARVPDMPVTTSVTRSGTTATLTFTAPTGALADGGDPITDYKGLCVSFDPTADPVSEVLLGSTTPAPITMTGLTAGKRYYCWVVAVNPIGDSGSSE